MADGAAIGFHNAFKDSAEIFPFIDAVSCSAANATGSFLGNATEGTDDLLLVTLILRWWTWKLQFSAALRLNQNKPWLGVTSNHQTLCIMNLLTSSKFYSHEIHTQ